MGEGFLWIDRDEPLRELTSHLRQDRFIAVDTEADSLHHYRESMCLIQISQDEAHFLVDPLAELDLSPLWQKLGGATWILQGADFDLRMMQSIGAPPPAAVFDTMIAGQLLGLKAFGYAALVERYFGATICKKNQKADWSRRPLPKSMVNYAVEDTRYLEGLAEEMGAQLRELGREEWHRESCDRVVRLCLQSVAERAEEDEGAREAWRIKGANGLKPGGMAILKSVWEWREREAEIADVPVFKVAVNEMILKLSGWADKNRNLPPPAWPSWPHRLSQRRTETLIAAVEEGRAAEPIARKKKGKRLPHDPKAEQRLDKLRAYRDHLAAELALDPSLIAPKYILQAIARDPDGAPAKLINELRWCHWQHDLLRPVIAEVA